MTRKRVAKVLELKDLTRDILEMELAKSIEELEAERRRLEFLREGLKEKRKEFDRQYSKGRINTRRLDLFQSCLLHLSTQIEEQQTVVSGKTRAVEEKRVKVVEAHREKRLFEILHERLCDRENKEAVRKEQGQTDFRFATRNSRK